jgi:fumarate reductase flavoprotein subunit
MELGPRDRISQAIYHEIERGRAVESPYGPVVHLDLRHLGADLIDTKLPFVRELCLKYERIDPVHELIPIRPVVHYMMGGVHTDIDGATPLAGLYAAGETACVSINGANRLGSNSLPELLVFGARAGRAAAEFASTAGPPPAVVEAQAADEVRRLERDLLGREPGRERTSAIRDEMQATMEESAGIYRTGPALTKGLDTLRELQGRMGRVGIADASRTFNTELLAALELANMLDIGECMLQSALHREESRGAHQRTDFPDRDDERFLVHQLAHRGDDGTPRISSLPVTITRWPPGERVYGR